MVKKRYEDMSPEEQYRYRITDSRGTIINGVPVPDPCDDDYNASNDDLNMRQLEAFMDAKARIDRLLNELTESSRDHFGIMPEAVGWGDVAFMAGVEMALRELADRVLKRGEYAADGGRNAP